jgi:hypothetical protein
MAEQRTFIFSVVFIILFSTILVTMPADLQGGGASGDTVTPINPNFVNDFTASEQYNKSFFSGFPILYYVYTIAPTTFECGFSTNLFLLNAHVLFYGLWLGAKDYVTFIAEDGSDRDTTLSFTEIDADAEEGVVRYNLFYETAGTSAGGLVLWWNSTTYATSSLAWTAGALEFLHGVGFTPNSDIVSLLVSLLFLQLPDCPVLINVLLATPIWACVVFLIWFIIKESLPFV